MFGKPKNKYSSRYNRENNARYKQAQQAAQKQHVQKPRKPMKLGTIALRNFVLLGIVVLLLGVFLLFGRDLTAFHSEKDLAEYADITSTYEEYSGRWGSGTQHVITVTRIPDRDAYAAAVLDLSQFEDGACTEGRVRIEADAISKGSRLEHILLLNPAHVIVDTAEIREAVAVYTNDAHFAAASGLRSAEEFYALQAEFEEEHANLFAILANDTDHLMYSLTQGNGWKLVVLAVLLLAGGLYAVYRYLDRGWEDEDAVIALNLFYFASMLATGFGALALGLVGEIMASEGGIAELIVTLTAILTGVSALLFLAAMLLPLLLDRDFLFGFSMFCWKLVLAAVVALVIFGIGIFFAELIEVYDILLTVIMIGLVAVLLFTFYALMGVLAAHTAIGNLYWNASMLPLEMASKAMDGIADTLASLTPKEWLAILAEAEEKQERKRRGQ